MEDEDLIQREDMVVTVSHAGYVKRVPLSTYRAQKRGGKGRAGMQTREEDFVTRLFVANTHTPVLFFSSRGQVYKEKVWRLPLAAPQARGKALINLLPLEQGERITTIMPLPEDESELGQARRDVRHHRRHGPAQQALRLRRRAPLRHHRHEARRGRGIVDVQTCTETDDVLLTTAGGQCIRFPVTDVRVFQGRTSMGVRGISARRRRQGDLAVDPAPFRRDARRARRLSQASQRGAPRARRRGGGQRAPKPRRPSGADRARRAALCRDAAAEQFMLTVSENGYGKRTSSYEYRTTGRGGKGIVAMAVNETKKRPAGRLVPGRGGRPDHAGHRRRPVDPHAGRRHPHRRPRDQGVIVFNTAEDERVVSVERLSEESEDEDERGRERLRYVPRRGRACVSVARQSIRVDTQERTLWPIRSASGTAAAASLWHADHARPGPHGGCCRRGRGAQQRLGHGDRDLRADRRAGLFREDGRCPIRLDQDRYRQSRDGGAVPPPDRGVHRRACVGQPVLHDVRRALGGAGGPPAVSRRQDHRRHRHRAAAPVSRTTSPPRPAARCWRDRNVELLFQARPRRRIAASVTQHQASAAALANTDA